MNSKSQDFNWMCKCVLQEVSKFPDTDTLCPEGQTVEKKRTVSKDKVSV